MKLNLLFLLVATLVISSQCYPWRIVPSTPDNPSAVGLAPNAGPQERGPSDEFLNDTGVGFTVDKIKKGVTAINFYVDIPGDSRTWTFHFPDAKHRNGWFSYSRVSKDKIY
ncbi:uncharacterized protein LOC130677362 [Microplitis mediator]|uniref:uncharacterized protein LOC130677362 n=1 Tax=Microplitis mediator TaxID=375433 RepID=UPI002554A0FB|nr:uncharacterized protein LOC130677362 [Microplitis mediator]